MYISYINVNNIIFFTKIVVEMNKKYWVDRQNCRLNILDQLDRSPALWLKNIPTFFTLFSYSITFLQALFILKLLTHYRQQNYIRKLHRDETFAFWSSKSFFHPKWSIQSPSFYFSFFLILFLSRQILFFEAVEETEKLQLFFSPPRKHTKEIVLFFFFSTQFIWVREKCRCSDVKKHPQLKSL